MTALTTGGALTAREDQILRLVGQGLTNRQIGDRLGIAEKTVKNTMTVILAKLSLHSRSQAAVYVTVRQLTGAAPSPTLPA